MLTGHALPYMGSPWQKPLRQSPPPQTETPFWTETPLWTETLSGQRPHSELRPPLDRDHTLDRDPWTKTPLLTDRCKNITFLQLRLRVVIMLKQEILGMKESTSYI